MSVVSCTVLSRNSLLIRVFSFVFLVPILWNLNWLPLVCTNCRPSCWCPDTESSSQFPLSHLLLPSSSNTPFILTVSKLIWGSIPCGTVVCLLDYLKDQILSPPLILKTGLLLLKVPFHFRWKTHPTDGSKHHLCSRVEDAFNLLLFSYRADIQDNIVQEIL